MKKKTISILSASMVAALCGVALSGCGGRGSVGDLDMTVDTRGASITMWTGFGTDATAALEEVLEMFAEETGITVTHEGKGGYDNLATAITGSASTITYPNVCVGYPDHFASYIDSDIQLRLDDFIEHDRDIPATRSGTVADPTAAGTFKELAPIDMSSFYDAYMVENQTLEFKADGTGYTLGLPFNKSTENMIYNKTFFDNAYIKSQGISLPETWGDVQTVGRKIRNLLSEKGVYGKFLGSDGNVYETSASMGEDVTSILDLSVVTADDFYPFSYDSTNNFFITAVRAWGGTYTSIDKATRKGYVEFNTQSTYDALNFFKGLAAEHILGIPASFGESLYCSTPFTANKSLMTVGSSAGAYKNNPASNAFETAAYHVPYKDADHKFVISQGTNLAILDKGSMVERVASWKLIKYLSQIKNGTFAVLSGYFPSCETAAKSADYQDLLNSTSTKAKDKIMKSTANVNETIYTAANGWTKFVDPGFNGSSTIRTSIASVMGQVLIDQADPVDVIASQIATLSDYVRQ